MSMAIAWLGLAAFVLLCIAYANWCDRPLSGPVPTRRRHQGRRPGFLGNDGDDSSRRPGGDMSNDDGAGNGYWDRSGHGWARHFWIGPATDGRLTPSLPSALAFLLAIWLGFAPFVLHYYVPTGAQAGPLSDISVAIVVSFLALARLVAPRDFPWLSLIIAALGTWLILAPVVLHYGQASLEVGNDEVVGTLLLLLGVASAMMTYRLRRAESVRDIAKSASHTRRDTSGITKNARN